MYDLLLTCTGGGDVAVDLTLAGLTEYAEFKTPSGGPYPEWTQAVDADLGSLVIHQEGVPEPMTIALLGLGGLLLRRRR
jgi:hypothetical protein